MGALLNRLLETSKPLPWKKALPQLVAKVAHAKRADPNALRTALLKQALSDSSAGSSDAAPVQGPEANGSDVSRPDSEFAKAVLQAAAATEDGRLGESKVFISRVWKTFQQRYPEQDLSLEQFKQRLAAANRQQQLQSHLVLAVTMPICLLMVM